jgi:hypothetical protein
MSQYDAAAESMWRCFTSQPNLTSFTSLPSNVDLNDKNVAINKWQQKSETFDFTNEDRAPDLEFSERTLVCHQRDHIPFPGPKRSAFVKLKNKKDEDDDD